MKIIIKTKKQGIYPATIGKKPKANIPRNGILNGAINKANDKNTINADQTKKQPGETSMKSTFFFSRKRPKTSRVLMSDNFKSLPFYTRILDLTQ